MEEGAEDRLSLSVVGFGYVKELGLRLQKGTVSLQPACSLVRGLHYCLSSVRGRMSLYYSVIDNPTTNVAIHRCAVSHAVISVAQSKNK